MRVRLTETAIGAAVKRAAVDGVRQELADDGMRGLRLRVTPTGGRTWAWGGRDRDGRARRFVLGQHPAMGISEAREAARAMAGRVRQGGADPVAEARQRRAQARDAAVGVGTLGALLELYGQKVGQAQKSWPEARRRIEHVFVSFLAEPVARLEAGRLQIAADAHPAAGAASAAVRYVRPVLKWGAKRGYVAAGVADLHQPATVGRRERVLSRPELAALLPVLVAMDDGYARAMKWMLWTLARREEVCGARWRDVDLQAAVWTIPMTKSGRPHVVPLPRQAAAFLAEWRPQECAPDTLVFGNEAGGRLENWDRATKRIMRESGTAGWTRHDLRRTGATMLGEMGVSPHVIEAALNHAAIGGQMAGVYNRSRYQPEVAAALQRLADMLAAIEAGGAEVVLLRRPR